SADPQSQAPRLSPGQVERHYAPRAPVRLLRTAEIAAVAQSSTGLLLYSAPEPPGFTGVSIRLPNDPTGYAHGLYAALHQLDQAGCTAILIEAPPDAPAWRAIHDRLSRAAH